MTLRIPAKVLIHVWSYDFYDMTLSTGKLRRHMINLPIWVLRCITCMNALVPYSLTLGPWFTVDLLCKKICQVVWRHDIMYFSGEVIGVSLNPDLYSHSLDNNGQFDILFNHAA